jgi:hypothetical protein
MKLFEEVRDGIVDSKVSLSTVLRKAKILGASLNHHEFRNWISAELNGYSEGFELPPYRRLPAVVLGTFSGPFRDLIRDYPLPASMMPEYMQEAANHVNLAHPIKEIEAMAAKEKVLRHPWPAEAVIVLRENINLSGGFILVEVYQPITGANLEGVADSVRNRLLDFLLELQKLYPAILQSDSAIESIPGEKIDQVFNLTVYGNNNMLATGSSITQTRREQIAFQDIEGLIRNFESFGVGPEDLEELREALGEDGKRTKGIFGDRVKSWIGKMVTKAVDGTWKVALSAAPELLKEGLSRYYGWK